MIALIEWNAEEKPTTACKHGKTDCHRCGTFSARDVIHKTRKGKGVVGQLPGGRKSR